MIVVLILSREQQRELWIKLYNYVQASKRTVAQLDSGLPSLNLRINVLKYPNCIRDRFELVRLLLERLSSLA